MYSFLNASFLNFFKFFFSFHFLLCIHKIRVIFTLFRIFKTLSCAPFSFVWVFLIICSSQFLLNVFSVLSFQFLSSFQILLFENVPLNFLYSLEEVLCSVIEPLTATIDFCAPNFHRLTATILILVYSFPKDCLHFSCIHLL